MYKNVKSARFKAEKRAYFQMFPGVHNIHQSVSYYTKFALLILRLNIVSTSISRRLETNHGAGGKRAQELKVERLTSLKYINMLSSSDSDIGMKSVFFRLLVNNNDSRHFCIIIICVSPLEKNLIFEQKRNLINPTRIL